MSEDRSFKYDIVAFRADMENWLKYLSNLLTMGIALAVTQQSYRLLKARSNPVAAPPVGLKGFEMTVASNIRALKKVHEERLAQYKKDLIDGPLFYPATAALHAAAGLSADQDNLIYAEF